jgi:predicted site-specific integrase-resolvase
MQHTQPSQIQIEAGQLYTPEEVRAWLKISRTTLWRYQRAGVLRPILMGIGTRTPRFRGQDLLAILAQAQAGEFRLDTRL